MNFKENKVKVDTEEGPQNKLFAEAKTLNPDVASPLRTERAAFLVSFLFLIAVVAILFAQKVPHSNEFVYLLRLDPGFLPHDWTFSRPANEHGFFNLIFSYSAAILSIEAMGWLGRILVWIGCLVPLIFIGRLWQISYLWITATITIWLLYGQTIANDTWFIGGFEAGAAASAMLLFSLLAFSYRKWPVAGIMLGLAFSLHPGVGLFAVPAALLALLMEQISPRDLFMASLATIVTATPGILFIVGNQISGGGASYDDWRFLVIDRAPWHLDPFYFSRRQFVIMTAMLAFNFVVMARSSSFALRFLFKFHLLLAFVFAGAIVLRWFEAFPLLRFQPMRLFPILVGIFFLFSVIYFISKSKDLWKRTVTALLAVALIALLDPVSYTAHRLDTLMDSWRSPYSDAAVAFRWVAVNTPKEAVVITPPNYIEVWYHMRRATVASFRYPTYDRFVEWRTRMRDLSGASEPSARGFGFEELEIKFNSLSLEEILELKERYKADYLVSKSDYELPKIFETSTYKVYRLR